jgi:hypothetical protein
MTERKARAKGKDKSNGRRTHLCDGEVSDNSSCMDGLALA